MARQIKGDPLTGALPATRLIVKVESHRQTNASWPHVPEPLAVTHSRLRPGVIATVRTRWGIKRWQVRIVNPSTARGRNRGRHYVIGMDRQGLCHRAWVDRVIHVESRQKALTR